MSKINLEFDLEHLTIQQVYALFGMIDGSTNKRTFNQNTCYLFGAIHRKFGAELTQEQYKCLELLWDLRKKADLYNERNSHVDRSKILQGL